MEKASATQTLSRSRAFHLKPQLLVGLALIAVFWPSAWLHWGMLGEYAFFPLWLGYILAVDGLVAARRTRCAHLSGSGRSGSLLERAPRHFSGLFLLSAPSWWLFESGNGYTLNWHYLVGQPYSNLHIFLEASIDFSVVIPVVLETAELMLTFDFDRRWRFPVTVPIGRPTLWLLMYAGAFMYLAIMFFPRFAFPFLWLWVFLLVDPLNWMRGRPSLLEQFSRGDLRVIGALSLGVLLSGFFWELWNFYSFPKWYYTVPYVGFLKVFEMPLLGYLGYIPFSWEVYALYQYVFGLMKKRTEAFRTED